MVLLCLDVDMFCAIIFAICCMYIYVYERSIPCGAELKCSEISLKSIWLLLRVSRETRSSNYILLSEISIYMCMYIYIYIYI